MNVKDLKKGDRVFESVSGRNFESMALEDAHEQDGGWYCRMLYYDGEERELFAHNDHPQYAPSLYSRPAYTGQTYYLPKE